MTRVVTTILALLLALCPLAAASRAAAVGVTVARVPEGGLQPQVVVDAAGTVHMIYLTGAPNAAKIRYTRSTDSCRTFGNALDVNASDTPAIATGTMRGPQLALGPGGTVHVAWMSSPEAMCYARLPRGARAFEKPRNLVTSHPGLDGGGSVAVDEQNRVFVAWHAPDHKNGGEESRRVYLATSADDGVTFSPERAIFDRPTGACACCGMRMTAAADGSLLIVYRGVQNKTDRALYLIASTDHGQTFRGDLFAPMTLGTCLMSTASFATARDTTLIGWETAGKVSFGKVIKGDEDAPRKVELLADVGDGPNQKYPSLAFAPDRSKILCAWTERTKFGKGGHVVWRIYYGDGGSTTDQRDDLPAFSLPAAFAVPNGDLFLFY